MLQIFLVFICIFSSHTFLLVIARHLFHYTFLLDCIYFYYLLKYGSIQCPLFFTSEIEVQMCLSKS